jgi:hypothetical protein
MPQGAIRVVQQSGQSQRLTPFVERASGMEIRMIFPAEFMKGLLERSQINIQGSRKIENFEVVHEEEEGNF